MSVHHVDAFTICMTQLDTSLIRVCSFHVSPFHVSPLGRLVLVGCPGLPVEGGTGGL